MSKIKDSKQNESTNVAEEPLVIYVVRGKEKPVSDSMKIVYQVCKENVLSDLILYFNDFKIYFLKFISNSY